MKIRQVTDEVCFAVGDVVKVTRDDLLPIAERARVTYRRRGRLCSHQDERDGVQEMLIVLTDKTYTPVHKHIDKVESFSVIRGRADVLLWDDDGNIIETIPMGDLDSGLVFYYRLNAPIYHSLAVHTQRFIFHEVTTGPWTKDDMVIAPWSSRDPK